MSKLLPQSSISFYDTDHLFFGIFDNRSILKELLERGQSTIHKKKRRRKEINYLHTGPNNTSRENLEVSRNQIVKGQEWKAPHHTPIFQLHHKLTLLFPLGHFI